MKQLLTLAALALAALTSCSPSNGKAAQQADATADDAGQRVLVAYFSGSGVTAGVAARIADLTGGTLHEITPAQPYTAADLDWRDKQSRSTIEMQDTTSRPAITDMLDGTGVADYDIVYVGFPIWWYTAPTIVRTFLESYDFAGKTVVPFATSGGSNIDRAASELAMAYPDINWKPGRLLNDVTDDELRAWIDGNKE